jgi:hypothetical protein
VPRPNPEKKVRPEASREVIATARYSIMDAILAR